MAIDIDYSKGYTGDAYTPNQFAELGDMIGKVAFQVIRGIETSDPLSVFDKGKIDNGDTIEQAIVKLVSGSAYDRTGDQWWTRDTTEKIAVRYFKDWNRNVYKTSVDPSEVRKVLLNSTDDVSVGEMLVSALGNSRIYDKFTSYKGLFEFGATTGSDGASGTVFTNVGTVSAVAGATDYKGIIKKIKDTAKGMQFVNSEFNKAGIKRSTRPEDIYVVMPYKIKNAIDVDELTGFFNLSKGEISQKIVETDSETKNIYVVDKNAILHYDRLYQMFNSLNPAGGFWNYFLHVEEMYALNELFDATYFTYE